MKEKKIWNASRICVSSLRRGHANLLCIVPILIYVLREQYIFMINASSIYKEDRLSDTRNRYPSRALQTVNLKRLVRDYLKSNLFAPESKG